MTDKIVKLNADNELVAENVDTGETEPVPFEAIGNSSYYEEVETFGAASGTIELDVSEANAFVIQPEDDITINLDAVGEGDGFDGEGISILIEQDSTQRSISWDSSIDWNGGEQPDDPEVDEEMEVVVRSYDGGSSWKANETWRSV